MNKHIYIAAVACGTVVGLASCSNEDVPVPAQGDATTFTVKLPADLATRAFGDGTTATDLHIAVYDSLGNALMNDFGSATLGEGCTVNDFSGGSLTTTVTLPLVKNKSYKILFWAQANGAPYSYDVAGKTVTVDYSKAATDAETMDAFYSYESIKADGKLHDVTLTRPFAQINIGTNDLTKASNAGMKVSKAGVSFAAGDLATTLDVTNGTAATPTTAATAFTAAALPSGEAFPATGYDYLTMAYVLVPSTADAPKVTLSQVSLFLNDDTKAWASFSNVPARGNYRTNIYGALLTNPEQFNVTINPDRGTPDINYGKWDGTVTEPVITENAATISSPEELAGLSKMVADGQDLDGVTFTLTKDLDMNNLPFTPIGNYPYLGKTTIFKGTIDGNGHTISNLNVNANCAALVGYMAYKATVKNLTIENSTIKGSRYSGGAVALIHQAYPGNTPVGKPTLSGVTVKNCNISGPKKVGGLAGFFQSNVLIENCVVDGCTIVANTQGGGLFGMGTFGGFNATTIQNNTVKNSSVTWNLLNDSEDTPGNNCGTLVGGNGQASLEGYNKNNVAINVTLTKK